MRVDFSRVCLIQRKKKKISSVDIMSFIFLHFFIFFSISTLLFLYLLYFILFFTRVISSSINSQDHQKSSKLFMYLPMISLFVSVIQLLFRFLINFFSSFTLIKVLFDKLLTLLGIARSWKNSRKSYIPL